MLSLLTFIWTRSGLRCWCTVDRRSPLFSVLCPSLAVSEAVTALSPEQSCEHTRSRYCCTCTDLIPNRVSANFCSFSTQNIQCTQCTALRADMTKKALLPLSMLASMGAILFYGHWGQTSLFFLSLFIPYHTWLYHIVCVYRSRNELMLAAGVRKVPVRTNLQPPCQPL